jgi:glycosyltransferase involved in cell wall biosynthesis
MKISISIPQFNRIEILLKSLDYITRQTYTDIEVVISDDCSTDETESEIRKLQPKYKYPLVYFRFETNQGYDRNLRKSIELATGEYCFIIGNDDTIFGEDSIAELVKFLQANQYPEIGYCNFLEGEHTQYLVNRALVTKVHGTGIDCALNHVNGFSFVGGIIIKRETFNQYNTDRYDGSIYSQMYLGLYMVAKGCRLFTISIPMVLKDLQFKDGSLSWSPVRNALPTTWSKAKKIHSGLLSVLNVLIAACVDAKSEGDDFEYRILKRMYSITFPYWVVQYKHYGNYYTSMGLISEMNPWNNFNFRKMKLLPKLKIFGIYIATSIGGLLLPYTVFTKIQSRLYQWVRR